MAMIIRIHCDEEEEEVKRMTSMRSIHTQPPAARNKRKMAQSARMVEEVEE